MKKGKDHSEIDYWQSNTDLMSALALVLLLIIMLLILYLMQIPEDTLPDAESGDSYNVDNQLGDRTGEAYHYPEVEHESQDDRGGGDDGSENDGDGGGGSGTGIGTDPQYNYEYPLPTHGGEEWSKAAVYVTVIDKETGRAIRKDGITFELYEEQIKNQGGVLRFLNTYYPVKIEYRNYETTKEGVFYLPEKIEEGHYYFKQITELDGYDMADAVRFDVDDIYDWPDPYVVSIEISPSKNVIPIVLKDMDTHEPVPDGTFKVTAAEDIITADQSIRYGKEELADTIVSDEEGHGESKELYLGRYTVTQDGIPRYYASIPMGMDAEVKKRDGNTPAALEFTCEKTKIRLTLADELYTNIKLEGAEFVLDCPQHPERSKTGVTDQNGELIFTDLEKNTVYRLIQNRIPDGYKSHGEPIELFVSEEGRIQDEAEASLALTNYMARVTVDVRDRLLKKPVSNTNLALYDEGGQLIRTWTTSGSAEMFENLPAGRYSVVLNGNKNKRYEYVFAEDKALQEFSVMVWTAGNLIGIVIGCGLLLLGIVGVLTVWKRKSSRRREVREGTGREQ